MLFWATSLHWLATLLAYFLMGCVGTSIGYHRLFGHKSFVPPRWLWWMCLCFGNLAGAGSSISWVAVHRAHHHHSNKNSADPHSPWHHKWYHVLWFNMFEKVNMRYVKDIAREPAHVWWHRLYFVVHFMLLVILLLISWKLAICAYLAPMALVWSMGSALNFVNHKWGYRNHNTADHSTNNWFYAIFY